MSVVKGHAARFTSAGQRGVPLKNHIETDILSALGVLEAHCGTAASENTCRSPHAEAFPPVLRLQH